MLTYFLKQSPRLTELRLTNIHPTGFHYMSVVLVHKAGFFVLYKTGRPSGLPVSV